MVPPFDDARTVAGQGTIGAEILGSSRGLPTPSWYPSVAAAVSRASLPTCGNARRKREWSGSSRRVRRRMTAALVAGTPVTLPEIDPFVDGAAVRRAGDVTYSAVAGLGALVASHVAPGGFTLTHVDEGAVCTAMLELYQNEGIIAEPAGALSVAALDNLDIAPGSTVVCLISGGNNDVSRYGEILERSLVHLGLKHYFLVDFPQEPGALRRFLDQVLGPDDDITLFEYVKRNNREFGPALVGIELGSPDGLTPLLERMDRSRIQCERLEPGSPAYSYLT